MFDKLKTMGALAGLMKNQDKLKESMEVVKEHLGRTRVSGQSGSGVVRVQMDGQLRVLEVEIAPALAAGMAADEKTRILAGGLIAQAVNDAIAQAQATIKETVDREAQKLGLGDLGAGGLGGLLG